VLYLTSRSFSHLLYLTCGISLVASTLFHFSPRPPPPPVLLTPILPHPCPLSKKILSAPNNLSHRPLIIQNCPLPVTHSQSQWPSTFLVKIATESPVGHTHMHAHAHSHSHAHALSVCVPGELGAPFWLLPWTVLVANVPGPADTYTDRHRQTDRQTHNT